MNKQIYLGDFNTIDQLLVVQNKLTYLKFSIKQHKPGGSSDKLRKRKKIRNE